MLKNTMAWSYRKNARHRNPKKDIVRKAVCSKTKRKTENEMVGWRVHRPKKDGCKRMERQSKESRGLEAYRRGGQGPPPAVAPSGGGGIPQSYYTCYLRVLHNDGRSQTLPFSSKLHKIASGKILLLGSPPYLVWSGVRAPKTNSRIIIIRRHGGKCV